MDPTFERELEALLNRYAQENASNTPDFLLAHYLVACLATWNDAVTQREQWYGRGVHTNATAGAGPAPVAPDA